MEQFIDRARAALHDSSPAQGQMRAQGSISGTISPRGDDSTQENVLTNVLQNERERKRDRSRSRVIGESERGE